MADEPLTAQRGRRGRNYHLLDNTCDTLLPFCATFAALGEIAPRMIAPAHCTRWRATHLIAREFAGAFVQNSVGTRFVL